jgi:hypothetical protein
MAYFAGCRVGLIRSGQPGWSGKIDPTHDPLKWRLAESEKLYTTTSSFFSALFFATWTSGALRLLRLHYTNYRNIYLFIEICANMRPTRQFGDKKKEEACEFTLGEKDPQNYF